MARRIEVIGWRDASAPETFGQKARPHEGLSGRSRVVASHPLRRRWGVALTGEVGGMKRLFAVVGCSVAVMGFGASSAFAGEITGNGKWIRGSEEAPLNGRSECAYSGQNDEFVLGVPGEHSRTQSWGQIVRVAGPLGGAAFGCNPNRASG